MNIPMQFSAPPNTLYELVDGANALAVTDQLTARLAPLHAMLAVTHGDVGRLGT